MSKDSKIAHTTASKRSREALQKRVVSVPFKDRLKGDQIASPPSDSWSWRKYGQKPIKGSPYPRGYYKCSSSKGCPARKQVERSRVDPTMLVLTYSCQHNHSSPPSKNNRHRTAAAATTNTTFSSEEEFDEEEVEEKPTNVISEDKFTNIICEGTQSVDYSGEFGWFADFESTFCTMIESPILIEDRVATDNDELAMIFTMREEDDESLFADLGELPECSAVLRRGAEQRRCSLPTTHLSSPI